MLLGILNILINARNEDTLAALVSREANVDLKALHHLGDGLPTSSDQAAVDTMVQIQLFGDLLLLMHNGEQRTNNYTLLCGDIFCKKKM